MMEILIFFLPLLALLPAARCGDVTANLTCYANTYPCSGNAQISDAGGTISVATASSCGSCVLELNAASQYGIQVDVESITKRKQFHHFYISYPQGQTLSFTGHDAPCTTLFPSNRLKINFNVDANFVIRTQLISPENECSENNNIACNVTSDCDELLPSNNVGKVTYKPGYAIYTTDYFHNNLNKWLGATDIRGELPLCPSQCICNLHYQQFAILCNEKTTRTLLLHPELEIQIFRPPAKVLDASNRQLESMDMKSFADLTYINRLILNNNLLTNIESGTFSWLALHIIELGNNKLANLQPDLFISLRNLALLDVHGNFLTSLHPNLFISQRFSPIFIGLEASRNNLQDLSYETVKQLGSLRLLILDQNNITSLQPGIIRDLKNLWWLFLDDNNLSTILPGTLSGPDFLARVHLSGNRLKTIDPDMFTGAEKLKELSISRNKLATLPQDVFSLIPDLLELSLDNNHLEDIDLQSYADLQHLLLLNISGNNIKFLNSQQSMIMGTRYKTMAFPNLRFFDANDNEIERIDAGVFVEMPIVSAVALRGNPLRKVDKSTFKTLDNGTYILVDEPATCCFIKTAQCRAKNPREPFLTCLRLLPFPSVRAFMWIFGLFAFVGNLFVLLWRCFKHGRENIVQVLLIENLAASDLLMGVYMLIIASADAYYQQYFPSESDDWRNGPICKLAGTISVISSEASVFFITLISIDRCLSIKYPLGTQRLTKKSALISLLCLWSFAFFLSIIPTSFSGVDSDFYDVSEVCIGLPFVRAPVFLNKTVIAADVDLGDYNSISSAKDATFEEYYIYPETGNDPGLYFSIVLFLGINFLCFLIVAISYIYIFILYKQSTGKMRSSSTNKEITLAVRMGFIVLTDFACWTPIVVLGILVQSAIVTISPLVYVYIVVFILPINSAVNPYIYTIAVMISDYRAKSRSRARKDNKMKKRKKQDGGLTASSNKNATSSSSTSSNSVKTPNTMSTSPSNSSTVHSESQKEMTSN